MVKITIINIKSLIRFKTRKKKENNKSLIKKIRNRLVILNKIKINREKTSRIMIKLLKADLIKIQ